MAFNVTAPLRAMSRPSTLAPLAAAIESSAITVPTNASSPRPRPSRCEPSFAKYTLHASGAAGERDPGCRPPVVSVPGDSQRGRRRHSGHPPPSRVTVPVTRRVSAGRRTFPADRLRAPSSAAGRLRQRARPASMLGGRGVDGEFAPRQVGPALRADDDQADGHRRARRREAHRTAARCSAPTLPGHHRSGRGVPTAVLPRTAKSRGTPEIDPRPRRRRRWPWRQGRGDARHCRPRRNRRAAGGTGGRRDGGRTTGNGWSGR